MNSLASVGSSSMSGISNLSPSSGPSAKMEAKLDSFLQSKGLSPEDRDSLKADLKSEMQSAMKSGSFPPDFQKMQDSVRNVFKKHGLDADQMAADMPKPPGFGGSASAGASKYSQYDTSQTLLDILQDSFNKSSDSNQQSVSYDQLSERLLSQTTRVSTLA